MEVSGARLSDNEDENSKLKRLLADMLCNRSFVLTSMMTISASDCAQLSSGERFGQVAGGTGGYRHGAGCSRGRDVGRI
jgi:hypothetical protein